MRPRTGICCLHGGPPDAGVAHPRRPGHHGQERAAIRAGTATIPRWFNQSTRRRPRPG
ncbi:hypothetical protein ACFQU7_01850 [Pseudoroseomonas wenyumeiae]